MCVEGIYEEAMYQVPSSGIPTIPDTKTAKDLALKRNQEFQKDFLGFPSNQHFDYSDLVGFLNLHSNNIGDPYNESSCKTNNLWVERNVLDYYASLWNIRWPHDDKENDSYWGYCLSMGSTGGNMYSMWNARDYVTGKALMIDGRKDCIAPYSLVQCIPKNVGTTVLEPAVFFSYDTHYSLAKTAALLQMSTFYQRLATSKYPKSKPPIYTEDGEWPETVPSNADGSINGDALVALVGFFAERGHPIVVLFNYGTIMMGAHDDVEKVGQRVLDTIREKSPDGQLCNEFKDPEKDSIFKRERYWIHVDGAYGASYMPFYKMGVKHGLITPPPDTRIPEFDFKLPFVCSIVTSSHKWIGTPWPGGVYLTRTRLMLKPPSKPGYVGTYDTTFAGSRNGLTPLLIWSHITKYDYEAQIKRLKKCFEVAEFTVMKLKALEEKLFFPDGKPFKLEIKRVSPFSLVVVFRTPHKDIVEKYSLSNDNYKGVCLAHIFTMEHVTKELIEAFITDLERYPGTEAFPHEPCKEPPEELHVSKAPAHKQSFQRLMPVGFGGGGLF